MIFEYVSLWLERRYKIRMERIEDAEKEKDVPQKKS
jgi:hypothetical protein